MYLPRDLISHLYLQLLRNHQPLSAPVLILPALEPDALCACRILSALLKRDFIPHKTQPISGYADLARAGEELVLPMRTTSGGSGGVVICIGVGGLVDLGELLGLETDAESEEEPHGIEVWVIDARRPWNLSNVFGGQTTRSPLRETDGNQRRTDSGIEQGRIRKHYKPGKGGIIVFDDGDIEEELTAEKDAYCALAVMPEAGGDDADDDGDDSEEDKEKDNEHVPGESKKRKSWSDRDEDGGDEDEEEGRRRQRRRSNSGSSTSSSINRHRSASTDTTRSQSPDSISSPPVAPKQPSARTLRRRLRALRRTHETVLRRYYSLGTSYSEPISSLLYSLASELGREDNDLLWLAIVGCSSLELSGHTSTGISISTALPAGGSAGWGGLRGERIRQILRDEVRRLNPPDPNDPTQEGRRGDTHGIIPTAAKSPTDRSIRLSPEPRFLLIRHWSLYDAMLHSPYLASRLHIWNDTGRKRLHKLLAKMGISLAQCRQSYTHMDMEVKKDLRSKLLKYTPMYGLDGLVPPVSTAAGKEGWGFVRSWGWKACLSATDVGVILGAILDVGTAPTVVASTSNFEASQRTQPAEDDLAAPDYLPRFWHAYDALAKPETLVASIPLAQHLAKAILRSGTSLLEKKQIRHLRAFRMGVVKDGPDVTLFTNPGALVKLALWVGEAVAVQEREKNKRGKGGTPLVLAAIDERRGVYVIVGTGGGGGVVDFDGLRQRKDEKRKKREEKGQRRKEREAKKARKAAERVENSDEDDAVDESAEEESEEDDDDDSDDEDEEQLQRRGYGRNRFGIAFQEVVDETNARVRIDSFEHSVVEVRKEDLGGFLESLSMKAVVGR